MSFARKYSSFSIWPFFFTMAIFYYLATTLWGEPWRIGDWLINFAGGPIRRGLIGSLLIAISEYGLPLKWLTFAVQISFYFFIFLLVQKIYLLRERGYEWLLILLSPAFLLFPFYNPQGGFRKEIILFTSFAVIAFAYAKKEMSPLALTLSLILYSLTAFSHELATVTLPFFLYVIYNSFRLRFLSPRLALTFSALFSLAAISALIFAATFKGDLAQIERICESVISHGLPMDACNGAIFWLRFDAYVGFNKVGDYLPGYIFLYLPLSILALLPWAISNWAGKNKALLLICFACISPLFFLGVDWGRWIHLYVFFVFTLLLSESVWSDISLRKFPALAVLLYLTTWSIPHCCSERMGFGLIEFTYRFWQWMAH